MINKDELIFAVDENNNPIEPVPRHQAHAEGIWHRSTDVIIINSKGEILCNKRSMLKDTGPGQWDFAFGGHLLAGEDPIINAVNETKEECGLSVAKEDLEFRQINKYSSLNGQKKHFGYIYLYHWDGSPEDLKLEEEEITEAKWFSVKNAIKGMTNNEHRQWVERPDIIEVLRSLF